MINGYSLFKIVFVFVNESLFICLVINKQTVRVAEEERGAEAKKGKKEKEEVMEGVASIALLPCGSISGHFIQLPHSICYGLHGTGNFFYSFLSHSHSTFPFLFLLSRLRIQLNQSFMCFLYKLGFLWIYFFIHFYDHMVGSA